MGAGNAIKVSLNWAHLPGTAFKVLTRMALICLDSSPRPRWWGGSDVLLHAIGRADPPAEDTTDTAAAARHANSVALRSALGDLVKAGALTYAVRPSRTKAAEFWVHFDPQEKPAAGAGKACLSRRENLQMTQDKPAVRDASLQVTPRKPASEEDTRGLRNTSRGRSP